LEPTTSPALNDLQVALTEAAPEIAALLPADRAALLRRTVYAAVDELKHLGLPSARVEAVVQSLVAEAWSVSVTADAVAEIRAWCIQRYYEPRR
jgi:hypothetical protein